MTGSGTICAPPLMLYWDSMCSGPVAGESSNVHLRCSVHCTIS